MPITEQPEETFLLFPARTRIVRRKGSQVSSIPLSSITPSELAALLRQHPLDAEVRPEGLTYQRSEPKTDGGIGSQIVSYERQVTSNPDEAAVHDGIVIKLSEYGSFETPPPVPASRLQ